jgi:hypothetical protein
MRKPWAGSFYFYFTLPLRKLLLLFPIIREKNASNNQQPAALLVSSPSKKGFTKT